MMRREYQERRERNVNTHEISEYEEQGRRFLEKYSIDFKARMKDGACPPWERAGGCIHGDHYRITLRKRANFGSKSLSFDFWNSYNDMQMGKTPQPYDVLAAISSEAAFDWEFSDFCADYGFAEDSRSAFAAYQRMIGFAKRAQNFFTTEELEALGEIQ